MKAAMDLILEHFTNDQAEALTLSDRIVVMYQGSIVQIGTAQGSEVHVQLVEEALYLLPEA